MDANDVRRLWEANADAWAALTREGYDVWRDLVNTPAFLAMLPEVEGRLGLDVGCGEGYNTREVAARGARMVAFDISERMVRHAQQAELDEPLGIRYLAASAHALPFVEDSFDFAVATMSLMDMPDQGAALREIHRVLRPGGFLQFSILHPSTETPYRQWVLDEAGERIALACGGYFEKQHGPQLQEWLFSTAPPEVRSRHTPFQVAYFRHTLSDWLNMTIQAGFVLEQVAEPCPDEATVAAHPHLAHMRVMPFLLLVRCRKPAR